MTQFWKNAVKGMVILGLVVAFFLTQTRLAFNRTKSLPYKAFICFKGLPPQRGDFVSLQDHPTKYFEGIHYIKRLSGFPGDKIERQGNQLFLEIKEGSSHLVGPLQPTTQEEKPLHPLPSTIIPKGYVFVSAEHLRSFDSRYQEFGLVKKEHIEGTCFGLFKVQEAGS